MAPGGVTTTDNCDSSYYYSASYHYVVWDEYTNEFHPIPSVDPDLEMDEGL